EPLDLRFRALRGGAGADGVARSRCPAGRRSEVARGALISSTAWIGEDLTAGSFADLEQRSCQHIVGSRNRPTELASALLPLTLAMRGVITGKDVVENVGLIYREFGVRCLARLLWVLMVGKRTTFLEVISQH